MIDTLIQPYRFLGELLPGQFPAMKFSPGVPPGQPPPPPPLGEFLTLTLIHQGGINWGRID